MEAHAASTQTHGPQAGFWRSDIASLINPNPNPNVEMIDAAVGDDPVAVQRRIVETDAFNRIPWVRASLCRMSGLSAQVVDEVIMNEFGVVNVFDTTRKTLITQAQPRNFLQARMFDAYRAINRTTSALISQSSMIFDDDDSLTTMQIFSDVFLNPAREITNFFASMLCACNNVEAIMNPDRLVTQEPETGSDMSPAKVAAKFATNFITSFLRKPGLRHSKILARLATLLLPLCSGVLPCAGVGLWHAINALIDNWDLVRDFAGSTSNQVAGAYNLSKLLTMRQLARFLCLCCVAVLMWKGGGLAWTSMRKLFSPLVETQEEHAFNPLDLIKILLGLISVWLFDFAPRDLINKFIRQSGQMSLSESVTSSATALIAWVVDLIRRFMVFVGQEQLGAYLGEWTNASEVSSFIKRGGVVETLHRECTAFTEQRATPTAGPGTISYTTTGRGLLARVDTAVASMLAFPNMGVHTIALQRLRCSVTSAIQHSEYVRDNAKGRVEPYHINFVGPSRCGKTFFVTTMLEALRNVYSAQQNAQGYVQRTIEAARQERWTWTRNPDDAFFSGHNHEAVIVMDDLFSKHMAEANSTSGSQHTDEMNELQGLIGTAAYAPNFPEVAGNGVSCPKGTKITPAFVVSTSNYIVPRLDGRDPSIIHDRIHATVLCVRVNETVPYANDFSHMRFYRLISRRGAFAHAISEMNWVAPYSEAKQVPSTVAEFNTWPHRAQFAEIQAMDLLDLMMQGHAQKVTERVTSERASQAIFNQHMDNAGDAVPLWDTAQPLLANFCIQNHLAMPANARDVYVAHGPGGFVERCQAEPGHEPLRLSPGGPVGFCLHNGAFELEFAEHEPLACTCGYEHVDMWACPQINQTTLVWRFEPRNAASVGDVARPDIVNINMVEHASAPLPDQMSLDVYNAHIINSIAQRVGSGLRIAPLTYNRRRLPWPYIPERNSAFSLAVWRQNNIYQVVVRVRTNEAPLQYERFIVRPGAWAPTPPHNQHRWLLHSDEEFHVGTAALWGHAAMSVAYGVCMGISVAQGVELTRLSTTWTRLYERMQSVGLAYEHTQKAANAAATELFNALMDDEAEHPPLTAEMVQQVPGFARQFLPDGETVATFAGELSDHRWQSTLSEAEYANYTPDRKTIVEGHIRDFTNTAGDRITDYTRILSKDHIRRLAAMAENQDSFNKLMCMSLFVQYLKPFQSALAQYQVVWTDQAREMRSPVRVLENGAHWLLITPPDNGGGFEPVDLCWNAIDPITFEDFMTTPIHTVFDQVANVSPPVRKALWNFIQGNPELHTRSLISRAAASVSWMMNAILEAALPIGIVSGLAFGIWTAIKMFPAVSKAREPHSRYQDIMEASDNRAPPPMRRHGLPQSWEERVFVGNMSPSLKKKAIDACWHSGSMSYCRSCKATEPWQPRGSVKKQVANAKALVKFIDESEDAMRDQLLHYLNGMVWTLERQKAVMLSTTRAEFDSQLRTFLDWRTAATGGGNMGPVWMATLWRCNKTRTSAIEGIAQMHELFLRRVGKRSVRENPCWDPPCTLPPTCAVEVDDEVTPCEASKFGPCNCSAVHTRADGIPSVVATTADTSKITALNRFVSNIKHISADGQQGQAVILADEVCAMPLHVAKSLREPAVDHQVFLRGQINFDFHTTQEIEMVCPDVADFVLVRIPGLGAPSGKPLDLITGVQPPSEGTGVVFCRDNLGSLVTNNVTIEGISTITWGNEHDVVDAVMITPLRAGCSGGILVQGNAVIGHYVGTNGSTGVVIPWSRQSLGKSVRNFAKSYNYVNLQGAQVAHGLVREERVDTRMMDATPPTRKTPTTISASLTEAGHLSTKAPAAQSMAAKKKCFARFKPNNGVFSDAYRKSASELALHLRACLPRRAKVCHDLNEALNGRCNGEKVAKKVNMTTSAGYPWNQMNMTKKDLINVAPVTGALSANKVLAEAVAENMARLHEGDCTPPICNSDLKDETRDHERVAQKKTRLFVSTPVDFNATARMAVIDFIHMYKQLPVSESFHAMGCDVYGGDWTTLANYLMNPTCEDAASPTKSSKSYGAHGMKYGAIDYGGFDTSHEAAKIRTAMEVIGACMEDEDGAELMTKLGLALANYRTHLEGFIVRVPAGLPSGSQFTTPLNCILNTLNWLTVWRMLTGTGLGQFRKNVRLVVYGDDVVVGMSPKSPFFEVMNWPAITTAMRTIGYTIEPATGDEIEWTSIENIDFLKRKWVRHPELPYQFQAPRPCDEIWTQLHWTTGFEDANKRELALRAVAAEFAQYPREDAIPWMEELRSICHSNKKWRTAYVNSEFEATFDLMYKRSKASAEFMDLFDGDRIGLVLW